MDQALGVSRRYFGGADELARPIRGSRRSGCRAAWPRARPTRSPISTPTWPWTTRRSRRSGMRVGRAGPAGGALAWSDATTPGLTAVHALMRRWRATWIFFEKASAAPNAPRPVATSPGRQDRPGREADLLAGADGPGGADHPHHHPHDPPGRYLAASGARAWTMADAGDDGARPDQRTAGPVDGGAARSRRTSTRTRSRCSCCSRRGAALLAELTTEALAALPPATPPP